MRAKQSFSTVVASLAVLMGFASCTDWGDTDPEAGNQVYPSRQVVSALDFEYGDDKPLFSDLDATSGGVENVTDDSLESKVLRVDNEGAARIKNPYLGVRLQNGAAVTFWVKTDSADLDRPLISFAGDDSADSVFYITANGQIKYYKAHELQSRCLDDNNPADAVTGVMPAGKWHFVAIQVSDEGYQFWIDGKKSLSGASTGTLPTDLKYSDIVSFINHAPYVYLGEADSKGTLKLEGAQYDDITFIRNIMNASDYAYPKKGKMNGGGSEDTEKHYYRTVGNTDCTSAWWTTFTDYFTIPSEQSLHLRFVNHTSGAGNWNNWNLVVTTDDARGGASYSEYFVLRSDLYGWGNGDYNAANITGEGGYTNINWDTFRQDMEGAVVDLTVERLGTAVNVTAVATAKNGTVYTEKYTQRCGDGTQNIRAFLVCDGSWFEIDEDETVIGSSWTSGQNVVGAADNSSAWWTNFSDYQRIPADGTVTFKFINHTSGTGNWNNWNCCVATDDVRGGANYSEYFVLRSDLYGWGNGDYNAANIAGTGSYVNINWDTFRQDMEGATVYVTISRSGGEVTLTANEYTTNGKVYTETYKQGNCGAGSIIRTFLIVDGSHLDMLKAGYMPYADDVIKQRTAEIYK